MYRYIVAMSYDREKIRDILISGGKQTALHLTKLVVFPNASTHNHWKKEVYNFLHDVSRLKGSNKYPKEKFIFDAISGWDDVADNLIIEVQDEEQDLVPDHNVDARKLEAMLLAYHKWAAHKLSTNGILTRNEVYAKIDELLQTLY